LLIVKYNPFALVRQEGGSAGPGVFLASSFGGGGGEAAGEGIRAVGDDRPYI
jgi:hypothetical protein